MNPLTTKQVKPARVRSIARVSSGHEAHAKRGVAMTTNNDQVNPGTISSEPDETAIDVLMAALSVFITQGLDEQSDESRRFGVICKSGN